MTLPYLNPSLTVEERIADLLPRMTLQEKVGQLLMMDGRNNLDELMAAQLPGSFLHIQGDDANHAIQLAKNSRLKIPLLIADDCIHGHSFWSGATIFPTQLSMACSWNPDLLKEAARITAIEVRPTGIQWTFSPVLCIARDLRWGRIGETFGEDPYLIQELANAMIKGYQGKSLDDPESILATAKHYAGYSETQGGRDASEGDTSQRKLRSFFLPPFESAVKAGCMTYMIGYQSTDGIPATTNAWLVNQVLKKEWKFKGILVTDWANVDRLVWEQKVCETYKDAAAQSVKSGNDLMMQSLTFFNAAIEAVNEGMLEEKEIDDACRRILSLKFKMGLFENPRPADLEKAKSVMGHPSHQAVNLDVARQSVVLLKNDDILPLNPTHLKRIAVIGPNADDQLAQLGDWSLGSGQIGPEGKTSHPRECTVTVLDGIRNRVPANCEVVYAKGCSIENDQTDDIAAAVEAASQSDLTIVVIGDCKKYIGEYRSTATLELMGGQQPLIEAVSKLGKPLIFILINSKPLVLPKAVQEAAAIVEGFNPGMQGGKAIAEILFGDINPSGKLPISFAYHVGQQPVYYNQIRGQHGGCYADFTQEPMFAFGFGLSYTRFGYSNLQNLTPTLARNKKAKLKIDVTNQGDLAGDEIIQAYIEDEVTSATWATRELKAFKRIHLKPGETKTVTIEIPYKSFSIVNAKGKRVVEHGTFKIHVGSSSRLTDLTNVPLIIEK